VLTADSKQLFRKYCRLRIYKSAGDNPWLGFIWVTESDRALVISLVDWLERNFPEGLFRDKLALEPNEITHQ
jgi:hypothetical protein